MSRACATVTSLLAVVGIGVPTIFYGTRNKTQFLFAVRLTEYYTKDHPLRDNPISVTLTEKDGKCLLSGGVETSSFVSFVERPSRNETNNNITQFVDFWKPGNTFYKIPPNAALSRFVESSTDPSFVVVQIDDVTLVKNPGGNPPYPDTMTFTISKFQYAPGQSRYGCFGAVDEAYLFVDGARLSPYYTPGYTHWLATSSMEGDA